MRKMTMMQVEELHKRYTGRTSAIFSTDGWVASDGISKGLEVEFDDAECPELGQRLIVMVESMPDLGPRRSAETRDNDPYVAYLEKRKAELASPQPATKPIFTNGRKFR